VAVGALADRDDLCPRVVLPVAVAVPVPIVCSVLGWRPVLPRVRRSWCVETFNLPDEPFDLPAEVS